MDADNLTLKYQVNELRKELKDSFINKIQEIENGMFKFKLRTLRGTKNLIISSKTFYLSDYKFEAPKLPYGYSLYLKKRILGKKILDVKQLLFERIAVIELQEFNLLMEFFSGGNIILLDKEENILMPFKREKWKDREIKKNIKYELPPGKEFDPSLTSEDMKKILNKNEKELFNALLSSINIAPIYLEEILNLLKIDKSIPAKMVSANESEKIAEKINEFYLSEKKLKPGIVDFNGKKVLTAIELHSFKAVKEFTDLNEAFDETYSKTLLTEKASEEQSKQGKKKSKIEFNLSEQIKAKEKFEKIEKEAKEMGENIYNNLIQVQNAMNLVEKGIKEKKTEEEIMYSLNLAAEQGILEKNFVQKIDLKERKIYLNIKKLA